MNAVIYARYSSASQTEQSIEGQLRVCREYAERNGLTVVNEYIDRATTGTNDNRPAFLRMIFDASNREFERIIVYKLDRFARNQYDSVVHKHKLKQYGVRVVSAMEAISDTAEGRLLEGFLEMFAEMYSQDLSQKVKRGLKESFIKGTFTGGNILYGYKVVDKKIEIDEEKAPAIRYAFEEYAGGKSRKEIVQELTKMGYRNRNGKPFSLNTFQNTFKNERYMGVHRYGSEVSKETYPAIVDEDIFEKVQQRVKQNAHAPARKKAKVDYILTGKGFCGHCGASLVGVSGTSKTGKKHSYYACSKHYKHHECDKVNEKKDDLEWFVVEQTILYVLTPKQMDKIATNVLKEYENSVTGAQIKDYEKRIEKIERQLDACFNEILDADGNQDIIKRAREKSDDLSMQKNDLQKELTKLQIASRVKHTKADIIDYLKLFIKRGTLKDDYTAKIVTHFVNSVYVFDDKTVMFYNVFDNEPITFEQMLEVVAEDERNEQHPEWPPEDDTTASAKKVRILNTSPRQCIPNTNSHRLIFFKKVFGLVVNKKR